MRAHNTGTTSEAHKSPVNVVLSGHVKVVQGVSDIDQRMTVHVNVAFHGVRAGTVTGERVSERVSDPLEVAVDLLPAKKARQNLS